jgi:tripartite-type tricarboxylate transporter receptor subunit TctC
MQRTATPACRWLLSFACAAISTVAAQDYPQRPIRILATEAGGSGDSVARLIVPLVSSAIGQPMIIDNRPGANVTGDIVARAIPDGYTLLVIGTSFWIGPLLQKTPYDPVKDFAPVVLMNNAPQLVTVHPSVPVKSIRELIALAKARPGELNYATTAIGGAVHLAPELFKYMASVNMVGVPYKGTAQAVNDVLGGQIQLMFPPVGASLPHVKSGRLIALAITSAEPSALVPGMPTVAASGVPGYEIGNKNGTFAPAKTPAAVINRLNQEFVRVLARPDIKEKMFVSGVEPMGTTPDQFAAVMKSDTVRLGKLIKETGIRAQ